MRNFFIFVLVTTFAFQAMSQGSYGGVTPQQVTNIVLGMGGGGAVNTNLLKGATNYGDFYIRTANGTSPLHTSLGWVMMTNQTGVAWGGANGLYDGASIWYNANHDAGGGELQLGSSHNFSFTDGMNNQSNALSHFGGSAATHGVWIYQYDASAPVGSPLGYGKYNGYAARYYNTVTSQDSIHYAGWRYEMRNNTTTNGELAWYGKMRGWNQAQLADEVANVKTAGLNDDGTWSMTGLNVTNNAKIGIATASVVNIGAGYQSALTMNGSTEIGGRDGAGVTAPEIIVQTGTGGGSSFITMGRLSSTPGDTTRFRYRQRDGTAQFELNGSTGYFNAGGFTFGGTTTTAGLLDASAMTTGFTYTKRIVTKTADYTATSSDSNTEFDNTGASTQVTFALPTASSNQGKTYTFVVVANQNLAVNATGTDRIRLGASLSNASGNIVSSTVGNVVTVTAHGSVWFVTSHEGTWTVN